MNNQTDILGGLKHKFGDAILMEQATCDEIPTL
jgi:hypothetical protein